MVTLSTKSRLARNPNFQQDRRFLVKLLAATQKNGPA